MENAAFLKSIMASSVSGNYNTPLEAMVGAQKVLFEQFDNFIPSLEKEAKELFELSGSESAEIYYKIESTSHNLHTLPGHLGKSIYMCTMSGAASYYGHLGDKPLITPEQAETA